jgi:hypothetical protein
LGTSEETQQFLRTACARLNAPLANTKQAQLVKFNPSHLPESLQLRLNDEGIEGVQNIDLGQLHRSHPIVTLLADHLLEEALESERPLAARAAVTLTADVDQVVTVYVLRLRHQLSYVRRRQPYQLMAEETLTLAVVGKTQPKWLLGSEADRFLTCQSVGNLPPNVMQKEIRSALDYLQQHLPQVEHLAEKRAQALLTDHQRVREASNDVGQYRVSPCLPIDVMGVFVLLPDEL